MTERLDEIAARITAVEKLGAVISAMRGIAAARSRAAETGLEAVDRYAATITGALARASATLPLPRPDPHRPASIVVAFLAEQGFAGAFSEKVLDTLAGDPAGLVLVGTRGRVAAEDRGLAPRAAHALPAQAASLPRFADRLARGLLGPGPAPVIDAVHAVARSGSVSVERHRLFPFPLPAAGPGGPAPAAPPLFTLPPADLLVQLMAEALHAGLCRAALHSHAAENAARMIAMAGAEAQTGRMLEGLRATERRVRQETITAEILELAAGEAASGPARR